MFTVHLFKAQESGSISDLGPGILEIINSSCMIHNSENSIIYNSEITETSFERDQALLIKSTSQELHFIEFADLSSLNKVWLEINSIKEQQKNTLEEIELSLNEKLPTPSLENLNEIIEKLQRLDLSFYLKEEEIEEFVEKLCKEFINANSESFFLVFKLLINSCEEKVLKEFLSEDNFPIILRALELDPELRDKHKYETWYKESAFKNVLDIKDEDFIELVKLNFRIVFLKEHLLTKSFEERVILVLNTFACYINEEIIRFFSKSPDIRAGLVIQLNKGNEQAIEFLKHLIGLTKSLVATNCRVVLFETFNEDEVFSYFYSFWNKKSCQSIIIELIFEAFCVMPWDFKKFFMRPYEERSFFEEFCDKGMDLDVDEVYYIAETLKLMFDNFKEIDFPEALDLFFKKILGKFILKLENASQSEASKCEIVSVFSVLLKSEPNESKISFVMSGLFITLNDLLRAGNLAIKISVYKFYKIIIEKNDANLISYFIKSRYFDQVFNDLYEGMSKENLIFSLTYGILLTVCDSSNKDLLIFINKEFGPRFTEGCIRKSFEKIEEKIQKINEIPLFLVKSADFSAESELLDLSKPVKRAEMIIETPKKHNS